MPGMGDHQGEQGQGEQASVAEAARRARDEMQSVTASLRALLKDLRDEAEPPPTGARSPGSAPSP
jgi:hypothetical protein